MGPRSSAATHTPCPLSAALTIAPLVLVPAQLKELECQHRKEDLNVLNSLPETRLIKTLMFQSFFRLYS